MNNRTQQRFDKSILDALIAVRETNKHRRRIDVTPVKMSQEEKRVARRKPKGRLHLDPVTGATVWEPAELDHRK